MSNAKQFGANIVENLNALLYTFVGFVTFFLLGCPAVVVKSSTVSSFLDSFGVFGFAKFMGDYNSMFGIVLYQSPGALSAAGVLNVFVLIFAVLLFVIGIFTLLKKNKIFDWKIDDKIGNFDTVSKLVVSAFAFFALLSLICIGVFAGANNANFGVGGGTVTIFLVGAISCALVWLVPVIRAKAPKAKTQKADNAGKAKAEKAEVKSKDAEDKAEDKAENKAENKDQVLYVEAEEVVLEAEVIKEPVSKPKPANAKPKSAAKPKSTATKNTTE